MAPTRRAQKAVRYEISPQWNPFSLMDFRPWKTPGLIYYVYSFYNYMLYVVGAPNFPCFFVGTSFIIMGISKGSRLFLGDLTSPGWHWGSPVVPLDSHSVGLFCPSNLASTTHGTFELLVEKCALTPPGRRRQKTCLKSGGEIRPGERKTKEPMNDGINTMFTWRVMGVCLTNFWDEKVWKSTCTCELRKLILHFDLKTNQMLGKFNPKN